MIVQPGTTADTLASTLAPSMSRIAAIFERLRREQRGALMPFLTGGFPSVEATREALPAVARAGGDIIEVGIPFSDPIADGPVIAESMSRALDRGVTPFAVLDAIRAVRNDTPAGVLAMVSVSIVERIGSDEFARRCAEAGVDGVIVPDIDLETATVLRATCDEHGLTCTFLVAPTTSPARLEQVVSLCSGFVYMLARVGITGEQAALPEGLERRIAAIRSLTDLPVAVGFGISTAAQVTAVLESADAAIVGSAIVRRMSAAADEHAAVRAAVECVAELGRARRTPAST